MATISYQNAALETIRKFQEGKGMEDYNDCLISGCNKDSADCTKCSSYKPMVICTTGNKPVRNGDIIIVYDNGCKNVLSEGVYAITRDKAVVK